MSTFKISIVNAVVLVLNDNLDIVERFINISAFREKYGDAETTIYRMCIPTRPRFITDNEYAECNLNLQLLVLDKQTIGIIQTLSTNMDSVKAISGDIKEIKYKTDMDMSIFLLGYDVEFDENVSHVFLTEAEIHSFLYDAEDLSEESNIYNYTYVGIRRYTDMTEMKIYSESKYNDDVKVGVIEYDKIYNALNLLSGV